MNITTNARRHGAEPLCLRLVEAGVKLPADITAAREHLAATVALAPSVPAAPEVDAAFLAGDPEEAARLVGRRELHQALTASHTRAVETNQDRLRHALASHADDLTRSLAEQAAPAIKGIQAAAAHGPTATAASLLTQGKGKAAREVADAPAHCARLRDLWAIRATVTAGSGGFGDCGGWRDPRVVGDTHRSHPHLDVLVAGVIDGGELWFPTPGEAQAVQARIDAEEQARNTRSHQQRRVLTAG